MLKKNTDDPRWQRIDAALRIFDSRPDALIEVLHVAQENFGYLDKATLSAIAIKLQLPPAKVFGVATFYNHFQLQPPGLHTLAVCTGTACHLKGNAQLLEWVKEGYGIRPGETTPDNRLSLVEVRCVGACARAPVFLTDDIVLGKKSFEDAISIIARWVGDES
ncbi:MAG: NAD(P)H-dependent oxidoreductase subunit E [Desulfobulbus sp.]|nr:NAD(P)H-dependent oxidoreductase subunit E [Desulfobulbus sp.]